jgi:hypothetical protein
MPRTSPLFGQAWQARNPIPNRERKCSMSSISTTTEHMADRAKSAARMARGSLVELGTQVLRLMNDLRERESYGLLLRGLGRRRAPSPLSSVLWFAAGAAAAGGAAVFFGPQGRPLRERIGTAVSSAQNHVTSYLRDTEASIMNHEGARKAGNEPIHMTHEGARKAGSEPLHFEAGR